MSPEIPLMEARNLTKRYPLRAHPLAPASGWVDAVCQVSLTLRGRESLGLVGESGSGKSTLARLLCGLIPPTGGIVLFRGRPVQHLTGGALKEFRKSVQIIFQDPMASLNPRMRIGQAVGEPLEIHGIASGSALRKQVGRLLEEVGLDPSWENRTPQSLSGGQRQRVGIARALALDPELLICDEPVSSLDLSVQAQILSLLLRLRGGRCLSLLFISHDLGVVGSMTDRILVMRTGRIIEEGPVDEVLERPSHPFTQLLVKLAQPGI